jgi:hypothetical protein
MVLTDIRNSIHRQGVFVTKIKLVTNDKRTTTTTTQEHKYDIPNMNYHITSSYVHQMAKINVRRGS